MTRAALTTRAKTEKVTNAHNDQDSDVSFEIDNDEEIDTPVIEEEEEDWIEYIRRSHGKDGKCEDSVLERDS